MNPFKALASLRSMDRNEQVYWIGSIMLFAGLTLSVSLFAALIVVGASMMVESVITSYIAGLINSRNGRTP